MKRWLNLAIVLALLFGGGLAIALDKALASALLFIVGMALGYYWNARNLLPE